MTLRLRSQPSISWKATTTTTHTSAYSVPVLNRYGQYPSLDSNLVISGTEFSSTFCNIRCHTATDTQLSNVIIKRLPVFPLSLSRPRHKEPHPSLGRCAIPTIQLCLQPHPYLCRCHPLRFSVTGPRLHPRATCGIAIRIHWESKTSQ